MEHQHDHAHEHDHEYEEVDVITLTLEDESEMDCAIIGTFPFEGKEYIALLPMVGDEIDEDSSILLYEYQELEGNEAELIFIEDEDYFNRVAAEFGEIYAEDVDDQGE